jgi:hypothetical protein
MANQPTAKSLTELVGISPSYASMILTGVRQPSRPLAVHIFRKTGWRHSLIADLSAEQLEVLESIEPWAPRPQDATTGAAAA